MANGLIPKNPIEKLFELCLLILGCAVALWIAVVVIEHIWVWLVVGGVVTLGIGIVVLWFRSRWGR